MFKHETRNVFAEKVSKITLSLNVDKRLQSFHKVKSCQYGTSVKHAKKEFFRHVKAKN